MHTRMLDDERKTNQLPTSIKSRKRKKKANPREKTDGYRSFFLKQKKWRDIIVIDENEKNN